MEKATKLQETELQELRDFAWHHGSATWLKEKQDLLEINTNYKGL